MTAKPMMILIAGPYRSGTGDDPAKMAVNLKQLEQASWPIFEKGHVPMIGEWVALPIWRVAGASKGADNDVAIARAHAIPVYFSLDEIPAAA